MCMAVAADLGDLPAVRPLLAGTNPPALQSFPIGSPAEIATPPPRAA
jgi:hypothetical protein